MVRCDFDGVRCAYVLLPKMFVVYSIHASHMHASTHGTTRLPAFARRLRVAAVKSPVFCGQKVENAVYIGVGSP